MEDEDQALIREVKDVVMIRITTGYDSLEQHRTESVLGVAATRKE